MPASVADASVIAAIAFGEPRAEEAMSLLSGARLHEPTLLAYELASIARKKALSSPGRRETMTLALGMALQMDVAWTEVDHPAVLNLALETDLTTYDASYLYLARSLGASLVTFDDRLRQASVALS